MFHYLYEWTSENNKFFLSSYIRVTGVGVGRLHWNRLRIVVSTSRRCQAVLEEYVFCLLHLSSGVTSLIMWIWGEVYRKSMRVSSKFPLNFHMPGRSVQNQRIFPRISSKNSSEFSYVEYKCTKPTKISPKIFYIFINTCAYFPTLINGLDTAVRNRRYRLQCWRAWGRHWSWWVCRIKREEKRHCATKLFFP